MADGSESCPNCSGLRVASASRTLQFDLGKKYVCGDCGAEWRNAWRPYLATAGFYGGAAVAFGTGGIGLWTFFVADSDPFGWQAGLTIAVALAIAVVAGYVAKRGWTILRSDPARIVVEQPGLTVELASQTRVRPVPEHRWIRSRWKKWTEGIVVLGFLALAAIFGTESYQERVERESRKLLRDPSQAVPRPLPVRPYPGRSSEPAVSSQEARADDEPFSEEILGKLEAWKSKSSREGSDSPYLDDVLRPPTISQPDESASGDAPFRRAEAPRFTPPVSDDPDPSQSIAPSSPDVKVPAAVPKE